MIPAVTPTQHDSRLPDEPYMNIKAPLHIDKPSFLLPLSLHHHNPNPNTYLPSNKTTKSIKNPEISKIKQPVRPTESHQNANTQNANPQAVAAYNWQLVELFDRNKFENYRLQPGWDGLKTPAFGSKPVALLYSRAPLQFAKSPVLAAQLVTGNPQERIRVDLLKDEAVHEGIRLLAYQSVGVVVQINRVRYVFLQGSALTEDLGLKPQFSDLGPRTFTQQVKVQGGRLVRLTVKDGKIVDDD